jgi:hypothetical protein
MLVAPADNAVSRRHNDHQRHQAVQNLSTAARDPFSEPVRQQHRGVSEPIVLQFPGPLLLVFCQLCSSCKYARSRAFILVYDRRNSEFSDRPECCQGAYWDRNAGKPDRHQINGADGDRNTLNSQEQNKVSGCLTERLSGKPQRTSELKLLAHGGAS